MWAVRGGRGAPVVVMFDFTYIVHEGHVVGRAPPRDGEGAGLGIEHLLDLF